MGVLICKNWAVTNYRTIVGSRVLLGAGLLWCLGSVTMCESTPPPLLSEFCLQHLKVSLSNPARPLCVNVIRCICVPHMRVLALCRAIMKVACGCTPWRCWWPAPGGASPLSACASPRSCGPRTCLRLCCLGIENYMREKGMNANVIVNVNVNELRLGFSNTTRNPRVGIIVLLTRSRCLRGALRVSWACRWLYSLALLWGRTGGG
jgi:hypothetical protein